MPWIPLTKAAKAYGVSASTLRRWAKAGKLERKKFLGDRKAYVDEDQVRELRPPDRP